MKSSKYSSYNLKYLLFVLSTTISCGIIQPTLSPTKNNCINKPATQNDIEYALNYTGNTFTSKEWIKNNQVNNFRVSITWLNNSQGGLGYLEYLIYDCGYTQQQINGYSDEKNIKTIIFKDYQNVNIISTCSDLEKLILLNEIIAESQGEKYLIRYWIKKESPTRMLTLLLAFPMNKSELLDNYSQLIFPIIPKCK
jgi:hypothetical protein